MYVYRKKCNLRLEIRIFITKLITAVPQFSAAAGESGSRKSFQESRLSVCNARHERRTLLIIIVYDAQFPHAAAEIDATQDITCEGRNRFFRKLKISIKNPKYDCSHFLSLFREICALAHWKDCTFILFYKKFLLIFRKFFFYFFHSLKFFINFFIFFAFLILAFFNRYF